jgi:hypothetical protein
MKLPKCTFCGQPKGLTLIMKYLVNGQLVRNLLVRLLIVYYIIRIYHIGEFTVNVRYMTNMYVGHAFIYRTLNYISTTILNIILNKV